MLLRQLGLHVQELEAGPLRFLISQSIPVAYLDMRPDAPAPGVYRSKEWFNKATTRHQNAWLKDKGPYSEIPHELVVQAFESVSRFQNVSHPGWHRRAEDKAHGPVRPAWQP